MFLGGHDGKKMEKGWELLISVFPLVVNALGFGYFFKMFTDLH